MKSWPWIPLALVFLCAAVRAPLLTRHGLWVDEVFSLAMATGHSLEQPAADSEAAQGDYVEGPGARPAASWREYLQHEDPPASLSRVLRAVRLSDTSPPLYYLVLWGWSRLCGTSDLALRGLSLALTLAGVPFFLALARRCGGRRALLPAGLLFAFTPPGIYYGTEGRMYALLWLCVLVLFWSALRLRARADAAHLALFGASALAGLLTHYFFAFVLAPCVLWLGWRPGRLARPRLGLTLALVALALAPWYAGLAQSLAAWRITAGWLELEPHGFRRASAALELLTGFLTGAARDLWGRHLAASRLALVVFALVLLLACTRRRVPLRDPRLVLPALWLLGALAGPLVFDAWRGTYTVAVPRYAAAGLPAALLLSAALLARLPRLPRWSALLLVLAAWGPQLELMRRLPSRSWCPLREVARGLEGVTDAEHVIVVHSIPSGVLGIARYYRGGAPIASWVEQLGQRRVPDALGPLLSGAKMVHLVRIHEVGAPAPVEDQLRATSELVWEGRRENATLTHFRPRERERF